MTVPQTDRALILSTGTAVPTPVFDQETMMTALGVTGKNRRFFEHPHIRQRHLLLPAAAEAEGPIEPESYGELVQKYLDAAPDLCLEALDEALADAGIQRGDIDFLCCVTSTAFLLPGLSKLLLRRLGLVDREHADIVGMGCSAGVNGLASVSNWCRLNPGRVGVLVCCEIASALYDHDESPETAIVNSLFGDGVAVAVIGAGDGFKQPPVKVRIGDFQSHIMDVDSDWFRYRWIESRSRYSFYLNKKIPAAIAAEIDRPLDALLKRNGLGRSDIRHWLFHTGGEAILGGIQAKLGLADADLTHTRSVLKDHGNLSSASIFFTLERFTGSFAETGAGLGVIVAMGPGPGIEACLVEIGP